MTKKNIVNVIILKIIAWLSNYSLVSNTKQKTTLKFSINFIYIYFYNIQLLCVSSRRRDFFYYYLIFYVFLCVCHVY